MSWLQAIMTNLGGSINEISDARFLEEIDKTKLLSDMTKKQYKTKLNKVVSEFFPQKVSIWWLIHHPDEFYTATMKYYKDHKKLAPATIAQYVIPIQFILSSHREIQEKNPKLLRRFIQIRNEIREPDPDEPIVEHKPTERQEKANMSFEEICKIRDELKEGSNARLLLSLYTMIEPLRSDFDKVSIYDKQPSDHNEGNFIVMDEDKLYLNDYKTSTRFNKTIVVDLPKELMYQIKMSLKKDPRDYLFTARGGEPLSPTSWNKWANRIIKSVLDNDSISLTSFRHIFLSRKDLDILKMPAGKRKEIADKMGHSLDTQGKYVLKYKGKETK